jgi:DNA-directed RNA polymerase subunit RPC12/RpoP
MATVSSSTGAGAPPTAAPEERKQVFYVCAVCLSEQALAMNQPIMCTHCAQEYGASKVFFKKREKATTYSTQ